MTIIRGVYHTDMSNLILNLTGLVVIGYVVVFFYSAYKMRREEIQYQIDTMPEYDFPVDKEVSFDEFYGIPNNATITFINKPEWNKKSTQKITDTWKE